MVFSLFQAVGNTLTRNIDEYKPYQKHIVKLVQKSDKDMNEYFRWVSSFDWDYRNYRTTFDRLKINRETPVIVFPDQSPNIPLYFFNLRGKTIFQEPNQDGLTKTFESLRSSGKDKEGYEYFIYLKGKNDAYDAEVKALSLDAIFEDSTLIVYKL